MLESYYTHSYRLIQGLKSAKGRDMHRAESRMGPNTELQVVLFTQSHGWSLTLYGYGVRQYACPDMDAYPNLWYLVFFEALSYTVYVVDLYFLSHFQDGLLSLISVPSGDKTGIKQPKFP